MRKIIPWALFLLIAKNSPGQCFNNVNTRTTDPKEDYIDGKNPNAIRIMNTSNQLVSNPNHFDWTDPTASNLWYWSSSTTVPPAVIYLPYYCDVNGVTNINGACTNQNIYYYQQLINNFPQGISLHDQNKMFDILPEDGWELIFKNFGTPGTTQNVVNPQPTFILYNRYTGKLKVFAAATGLDPAYTTITNVNRAALRVSFPYTDKTALLGLATPISQVMKSYTVSATQGAANHFMNNEFCTPNMISYLAPSGSAPPQYQWLTSEFVVPYDPCTCFNTNAAQIKVSIVYWSNSTIDMGGLITGKLNASPAGFWTGNNLDQNNKGASVATDGNVLNGIEGALKTYETWSGYAEKVKKMFETKSGGTQGNIGTTNIEINTIVNNWYDETGQTGSTTQQQKNAQYYNSVLGGSTGNADEGAADGSGFLSVLNNVASISPYVAAVVSLVDFVVAGGQENTVDNRAHVLIDNPSPPLDYHVDEMVQLQGQISTQTEPTSVYAYVPGSKQTYNVTGPAPIYNNILGVFNILEQPTFERTPLQITYSYPFWTNYNFSYSYECIAHDANGPLVSTDADFNMVTTPVLHYKINQGVKYLINPNAHVDVVGIDAAIVVEYDNTENFQIVNSAALSTRPMIPFYSQMGQPTPYAAPPAPSLQDRINYISAQSGLTLEYMSDDFPSAANSIIRFRTPYVPLECMTNLNFLLYGNTAPGKAPKTYLKLVCKFVRQNSTNADPIIHIQTFDITDGIKNPSTQAQINNAGVTTIGVMPSFAPVCNSINTGSHCLTWTDASGAHPCDLAYSLTYGSANFNSFNLTQFAYQNPFIANNTIGAGTNNMSNTDMVISGDVSIGTTDIANGNVSFQTPNASHIIGTATNPGPNGTVARIFARKDVIFNGTFTFMNSTDVRAGEMIEIPPGSEATINADAQLIIDPHSILGILMGCTSSAPVTSFEASTNDANALCNGGALRMASPPDTAQTGKDTLVAGVPENGITKNNFQRVIQNFNAIPNPTDGHLKVVLTNATDYPASVSIENVLGYKVYELKNPDSYEINLDLTQLPKGLYIIRVDSKEGGAVTKRIIKD
jgi:hypothetical protein